MLPSSQMITPNVKKNVIIQSDNKINVIIQQHDKNKHQGILPTSQMIKSMLFFSQMIHHFIIQADDDIDVIIRLRR
jgi:hypothetical protein